MSLQATASSNASTSSTSSISTSSCSTVTGNANNNLPFEKDKIWYFSNEQLANSPSRRCGIKVDDELHYRQMTAYLIQEMGQRLQVSQLCINTAIVYMHRFYAFHSFTHFHRNSMASASLFLAAKVEEQPRKLEHVIRAAHKCLPPTAEQNYADLAQELVFNENVLLQTLGFDVAIDHPHTHVVRTCQLVKACKDLAQTSYFLASNSLHLTSMCLQYRPTVVACFCIYLACKWSRWEIPQSTEGKHWFYYVDKSVSLELLKQLTDEFIAIYEKSPARLKSKLNSIKAIAQGASNRTAGNSKDNKPKEDWKMSEMLKGYHSNITAPPELMNGSDSREPSSQQVAALLPPPAMVPQQRRGGDHVNHQRSSVSNTQTNSSTNHNKLPNYPGALPPDAHADHKSKQQSYNNRAPSGHQSSSSSAQRSSSNTGSMPSSSSTSNQRSSSASAQSRQPMPMDYHKPSRSMPPVGMPPHGAHKMPPNPKQPPLLDGRSSSSSVASGNSAKDAVKSGSSGSSSKMYSNAPPPYNSSAPNSLMHSGQPRGGYMSGSSSSSNNGMPPSSSYHTHRNKSSTTSSSSSSVHSMPPYEQLTATLPYGQSANSSSQHMANYNSHMQMQIDGSGTVPPPSTSQTQQQQQPIKNNSLFSPEWSDIKKEPSTHYNGLLPPHENLGYKLNNHAREKDSPKKDRLSTSGTPTKKEKHRTSGPGSMPPTSTASSSSATGLSNILKAMLPPNKKPPTELMTAPNELAGTSRDSGSVVNALKRANELSSSQYGLNKLDEDTISRDKLRKIDNSGLPGYSYNSSSSSIGTDHDKHAPLSMSNGIETTPDLVRSLLKESLCTSNASLLKPESLTMPGPKPPAELFEPMPPMHIKKETTTTAMPMGLTNAAATGHTNLQHSVHELDAVTKVGDAKEEGGSSTKSEKKKKKDKHKHKEKDKSKDKCDKEERKKHKKDKQKDRAKDVAGMINPDSLKLVIKTSAVGNPNGLVSIHTTAGDGIAGAAAPLKLKISKNKVEPSNYSMAQTLAVPMLPGTASSSFSLPATSTATTVLGMTATSHAAYAGYGMPNVNVSGGNSSSSSGKKKDRDRERDKEKKSKNQDYAKYNGIGANYAPVSGAGGMPIVPPASLAATVNTLPPGMLMNTMTTTTPLPVYTKK